MPLFVLEYGDEALYLCGQSLHRQKRVRGLGRGFKYTGSEGWWRKLASRRRHVMKGDGGREQGVGVRVDTKKCDLSFDMVYDCGVW
jgi:hypothetical protein